MEIDQAVAITQAIQNIVFLKAAEFVPKPCSSRLLDKKAAMRLTDERLLLRLTGITISMILLFTTALSVSEENAPMSPSQRVILNSEKERIAELYTFTKWEDDNPSVLVAAAQTLARYHALAVPHPASEDEYFSLAEKLKKSIDVVLPQMDKLKEAKQYLSMEKFLGFKDIVGTLEEKLNEWPSVLVWSSAERIGEDGPPKPPSDRLLVHRGFDTKFFLKSDNWGQFKLVEGSRKTR